MNFMADPLHSIYLKVVNELEFNEKVLQVCGYKLYKVEECHGGGL